MVSDWRDFLFWWLACLIAGATVVGGKLGVFLWKMAPDPPSDPALAAHWRRRRRWLAYAELSALPAFATIALAVTVQRAAEPILSVLISMALGAIGFTLLLDGIQWVFRQRLGLPGAGETGDQGHG